MTASLLDALGHHRDAERSRLILHHRDGTPLPVHLHAVPVSTAKGSQLVIALKDQSEQQAIEDQTEILAQRALLGEVTAIFAHEVRNPINNISTGVQLAASRLGKDHPQYESLERVRAECIRLDQLMTDVLFFARPLELKMEALDLVDLMQRILARWAPRFSQSNVRCHTDFKAGPSAGICGSAHARAGYRKFNQQCAGSDDGRRHHICRHFYRLATARRVCSN